MTNLIHALTVPVFETQLKNAKHWLDKASAYADHKKFNVDVLLTARLAPDMFHFTRQIQVMSDNAKGISARLAGVDIPSYEDSEKTVADLHARLDKTLAFLKSIDVEKFVGAESRKITVRPDRVFDTGLSYVQQYAMPNFFFHCTTAYAILRHNGVDVGKTDFLHGGRGFGN
jgi:hypothetical protein